MLAYKYAEAIAHGFPGTEFSCPDDGATYETIVWQSGNPLPTKAELDAWILEDVKVDMWDLIKQERDRRKLEGGYQAAGSWFHSDTTSRIQQIGLVMMGANIPANLYWKTMSGSFVLMTQTLAMQIFMAAAAADTAVFTVAEQKKAAMLASPDPANYDYLSGWPAIYGE